MQITAVAYMVSLIGMGSSCIFSWLKSQLQNIGPPCPHPLPLSPPAGSPEHTQKKEIPSIQKIPYLKQAN